MSSNDRKDLNDILEAAIEQGWKVIRTKKNHFQLIPPDRTKQIVLCASTPTNPRRDRRNTLARMCAAGFNKKGL